ncbi:MAG: histidinol-phosphatase HisJ family protein [Sphaerochaetaceae bacterium]|jgi:histidinol-phosphatase (PHP family)|nr:histidinol-phosphatase HisJ family protein [Sphaerochaetaceae bacterium]MDD2406557.1 histidinol-phosphatase HisJ family protein [Sphaerochaetaceae bacterium]MDD4259846.1 histidinol-phosphatase HisJ family protein [Sphaerochaetaceae bacterium]NLO61009.1 histidinol-phosphatase HisJ family protein [Spirochaetales bacterium]
MIFIDVSSDMHTHPFEKGKTKESMERFVERAIERKLATIAFTEHAPMAPTCKATHTLSMDELESYYVFADALKEKYRSKIKILVGIEADYHQGNLINIENLKKTYAFDLVLGSIHLHVDPHLETTKNFSDERLVAHAFDLTCQMIETDLFDGLAHLDFFRYALALRSSAYDPKPWRSHYEQIYEKLEQHTMFLEVNTSGLSKNFNSILPATDALAWSEPFRITYSLASDAHAPSQVAYMFTRFCGQGVKQ